MEKYLNKSRDSCVIGYEIGEDYIDIIFNNRLAYRYSYFSAGKENVEKMKLLAKNGDGLNSFINQYCKFGYLKKYKI